MTDESLRALDYRREIRDREGAEYKSANREIEKMCSEAKNITLINVNISNN